MVLTALQTLDLAENPGFRGIYLDYCSTTLTLLNMQGCSIDPTAYGLLQQRDNLTIVLETLFD